MTEIELSSWISLALMRIGTGMATAFDRFFADLGVNQAQFRMLLAVWEHGQQEGVAPSQLAHHLLVERGTVSVMSQRMVKRGWLRRLPGPDRRSHRLALTAAGGEVLQKMADRASKLGSDTFAGVGEEQLLQLKHLLKQIEEKLHENKP
ncbi:MAG: MarR family transcriptional regulator [Anaerolineales bacterium]|nr:MarR family transcriptional regulator [Anaerolineales bacterium]